ncbi:cytoplasmic tRNA 2-thiolation protein CTU2 [Acrasis kona]|uniref:Cytoplasmic tRNA 2-thiolation protein CTU2 n=1 Tax=Acrasis kona TaxID=1008807 RepID=A0AAW2YW12_9EUKA
MLNHLMQEIVSPHSYRTISFFWSVLYIDIGAAVGLSEEERLERAGQVRDQFASREHGSQKEFYIMPLEYAFRNDGENCVEKMQDYLNSFKQLSAREDALRQLVQTAILNFAQENNFSNVITAESASNLSIRVITEICKGRGFNIPLITSYDDSSTHEGVRILRPLKDKLAKEIAFYNAVEKLKPVFIPDITTGTPLKSSVDRLVEEFISSLQANFPSTVHAILRTTEKLKVPNMQTVFNCVVCNSVLTRDERRSQEEAVNGLHTGDDLTNLQRLGKMSCYGCCRELDFFKSSENCSNLLSSKDDAPQQNKFVSERIAEGKTILEDFPIYVNDNIHKLIRMSREQVKESISEYLIEDQ